MFGVSPTDIPPFGEIEASSKPPPMVSDTECCSPILKLNRPCESVCAAIRFCPLQMVCTRAGLGGGVPSSSTTLPDKTTGARLISGSSAPGFLPDPCPCPEALMIPRDRNNRAQTANWFFMRPRLWTGLYFRKDRKVSSQPHEYALLLHVPRSSKNELRQAQFDPYLAALQRIAGCFE